LKRLEAEIVVLGAGIAGLTAARVLQDAGLEVLVLSEELGGASTVPVALLNPVRGQRGSVAPEAEEALEALWAFYPRHTLVHRGVVRPVPEPDRAAWRAKLHHRSIPHRWTEEGIYLENAAWLEPAPLLARLREGLNLRHVKIAFLDGNTLYTAEGEALWARRVIYAGGASGAHLVGLGGRFTAGSVLGLRERFETARSYGVYVAGNSLGGSYLPHTLSYTPHTTAPEEVEWLLESGQRLLGYRVEPRSSWAGVRYRLDRHYLRAIPGGFALTGFGSAGFFYAPLYARRLLERIRAVPT